MGSSAVYHLALHSLPLPTCLKPNSCLTITRAPSSTTTTETSSERSWKRIIAENCSDSEDSNQLCDKVVPPKEDLCADELQSTSDKTDTVKNETTDNHSSSWDVLKDFSQFYDAMSCSDLLNVVPQSTAADSPDVWQDNLVDTIHMLSARCLQEHLRRSVPQDDSMCLDDSNFIKAPPTPESLHLPIGEKIPDIWDSQSFEIRLACYYFLK